MFKSKEMSYNYSKDNAKILVLGDSGVGKSSLIHLICHSSVLSNAQWTIGCSIDVKLYDSYFLEFWDIGGSRSHKIARSFLYQEPYFGIMLVFDATNKKSRANLTEWLMEVAHKNNEKDLETFLNTNIPIIKIATKKDLLPYDSYLDTSDRNRGSSEFSEGTKIELAPLVSSHSATNLSASSSPLSSSSSRDPLSNIDVIRVNTQDVLSFQVGTRNYERLSYFFKRVIQKERKL